MNRKFAAIAAAAVMLITAAGCSDNGDDSSEATSATNSSTTASAQGSGSDSPSQSLPTGLSVLTSGTSPDTVVATVDGHEDMNVTFGEFMKEYKYRLAGYQITDDTDPMYASTLQSEREYIINYLINEEIMYKKFEELGFTLTDEDNAQIDADTEAGVEGIKQSLKQRIKDTELLSEEDLDKRVEEEYEKLLADCGLTYDDIRYWQQTIVVQQKLTEHVNKDYVYDPDNTEQQMEDLIQTARNSYKENPAAYDATSYAALWIPEGSRAVKHILVKFDDETVQKIVTLREEGKTDEADSLKNTKLEEISAKITEIEGYLNEGQDFETLMNKYSDDGDTTMTYIVCPDTEVYMEGFAETAFAIPEIGGTAACVTDYGWHMIKYVEEAVVTDDELKEYKEALHSYMEEQYISQNYGNAVKEWRTAYTFEIDRDTLLLAEESSNA